MGDLKVLIYLDMLKLKNQILEIFKSPVQFLKKSFMVIYFIGLGCLMYFPNRAHGKEIGIISGKVAINIEVILAIVAVLLILVILATLFSDYTPSNFSLSDIQYLFPSPLNNKNILLYSLVKSSIKRVLASMVTLLFFILVVISRLGTSISSILILALGLFFVFMFFMSLGYLIFSLRVKFSLDKVFKIISYVLTVAIGIFILTIAYVFYTKNFNSSESFNYLYNSALIKIPFVSSMVAIFSSIIPNRSSFSLTDIFILLSSAIFNFIIFFSLKVEYYEAIAEKVEDKDMKIKEIKSVRFKAGKSQIDNKIKKVNYSVKSKERRGVLSLYWKNSIMRKRRNTPVKKYLLYALNIIIGAGVAYSTYSENNIVALYIVGAATIYGTLIFSAMTELYRELKTLYIYLIPGSPISKILSASLDELLTLFYRILIMLLPAVIVSKENIGIALGILLVILTACAFLKLQSIILVFMIPDKPTSPPILYMLYTMFIVAIPAFIGGFVFASTSNYYLAIGLVEVVLIAYISVVLLGCELLFNKIQY